MVCSATRSTKKRRPAFTLVELIVVVVVLGLLASIAIVGYKTVVDKSLEAKQLSRMSQILKEAKALYLQRSTVVPPYPWDQAVADAVDDLPTYSSSASSYESLAYGGSNLNTATNGWVVQSDTGSNVFSATANDIVVTTSSGVVYIASAFSSTRGVFGMVSQTTAPRVWAAACAGSSCDAESATSGPPAGGAYSAGTTTAPTTTAATTTTAAPTTTIPVGSTMPAGSVVWYAGSSAPTGWLKADGSAVSRSTYSAAFSALGTAYGAGNGSTTFNLPDLSGRVLVGKDSTQTEFDQTGETGGVNSVALTTAMMPAHAHTVSVSTTANTSEYATTSFMRLVGVVGTGIYFNHMPGYAGGGYADVGDSQFPQHWHAWSASASATTQQAGSSTAHNNLQPYLTLTALVAVGATPTLQPGMVLGTTTAGAAPSGWALADGSAVSRTSNAALFAVASSAYGAGDGSTTFNLPNAKGRTVVGQDSSQASFSALGNTGGEKSHTLTVSEMPLHDHTISLSASGNTSETPRSSSMRAVAQVGTWISGTHMVGWAGGGYADYSGSFPQHYHAISVATSATSSAVGSGSAHNELQPYKAVQFMIATSAAPTLQAGMIVPVLSTAAVPAAYSADLTGQLAVGVDSTQAEFDVLSETGGTKTETLTIAQLPSHSHAVSMTFNGSTSEAATASWNRLTAQPGTNFCCDHMPGYASGSYQDYSGAFPQHYHSITINASGTTSSSGSGQSHSNLQPYMTAQMWKYSGTGSTSGAVVALPSSSSNPRPVEPWLPLAALYSACLGWTLGARRRNVPVVTRRYAHSLANRVRS